MESALDFFRRGESILRIELQENEITLGEYAVKHSMLYQKAKEMEKSYLEKLKDFNTWKEWKNEQQ